MKILFLDGTKGFCPTMLSEGRPTGGICTSLSIIPRKLAAMGHEVYVHNIEQQTPQFIDGVNWITKDPINPIAPDVVVYNRNFIHREWLAHFRPAKSILWLHDIPQFNYFPDDAIRAVDRVVALSEYQRRSYAAFYRLDAAKIEIIENGVDKDVFYPGDAIRIPIMVYASAPVKGGLELLGELYKVMKQRDPAFRLVALSSQSLHSLDNTPFAPQLEKLKSAGVELLEPISQRTVASYLRSARALLMPNTYPENCSNIALQARACGCPIVASAVGDMADKKITDGVLKTDTSPHDLFWHYKDFIDRAIHVYENEKFADHLSQHAPIGVKTWDQIAVAWQSLITGISDTCPATTAENNATGKTLTTESVVPTADPTFCEYGG